MSADRDYIAEMDEQITDATEGSGWTAAIVAAKLYGRLLADDRDLLEGWLHEMATDTLRHAIIRRSHAARMRERARAARGEFADAARDFETGADAGGMKLQGMFALTHVVDAEDIRKRAGEMTGTDHLFVAESYQSRGQKNLMEAAFHRAVAEKVGEQRTDQVFSLQEYETMYRSVVGS